MRLAWFILWTLFRPIFGACKAISHATYCLNKAGMRLVISAASVHYDAKNHYIRECEARAEAHAQEGQQQ